MCLQFVFVSYKYKIQVSLAIRGGYVPDKFKTANTKTLSLGSKLG